MCTSVCVSTIPTVHEMFGFTLTYQTSHNSISNNLVRTQTPYDSQIAFAAFVLAEDGTSPGLKIDSLWDISQVITVIYCDDSKSFLDGLDRYVLDEEISTSFHFDKCLH